MTSSIDKIRPLAEAVDHIRDGDVVAVGGQGVLRHPMALVREIVRQGRRRLHVVGLHHGIGLELLIGAGCVATLDIPRAGPDHPVRRVAEAGGVRLVERSGTTALDRFRAGSLGLPLLPGPAGPGAGPDGDPHLKPFTDPFTGATWMAVEAIRPDVALIHAHAADARGNVQLDAGRRHDPLPDVMIARSARTVIVSVEQVVSGQAVMNRPDDIVLPGDGVTCVVEAPYGAHPYGCDDRYDRDPDPIIARHPDADLRRPADHWAYLDAVGMRRLMAVSTRRAHRA